MTSTVPEPDRPATQAKRDSEALLAALISFSRDAIVSTSPQGVIQTWNDGAQRLLGWAAQNAVGQPMLALVTDMANEKGRDLMARAMRAEPQPTRPLVFSSSVQAFAPTCCFQRG